MLDAHSRRPGTILPVFCLARWRGSAVWVGEAVFRGAGLWRGRGMGSSREGEKETVGGAPVAPAFLALSPLVVTAGLLASPRNCPFVVWPYLVGALSTQDVMASHLSPAKIKIKSK